MREATTLIDRWVQQAGRAAVLFALVLITALLGLGILMRALPELTLSGYDEVVELLMAWMTFLGAALLWREGTLYRVDVLADRLPGRCRLAASLLVQLLMLLFALVFTVEGYRVALLSAESFPFLRFSKSFAYASMPVSGLLMIAYTAAGIVGTLLAFRTPQADTP
ncbi:MAG: TRAP transporter small permease [Candidatus Methylomirabilota bacterium]